MSPYGAYCPLCKYPGGHYGTCEDPFQVESQAEMFMRKNEELRKEIDRLRSENDRLRHKLGIIGNISTAPTDSGDEPWSPYYGTGKSSPSTAESEWVGWPENEPARYNASTDPCDMWTGPCACGAWHKNGK